MNWVKIHENGWRLDKNGVAIAYLSRERGMWSLYCPEIDSSISTDTPMDAKSATDWGATKTKEFYATKIGEMHENITKLKLLLQELK